MNANREYRMATRNLRNWELRRRAMLRYGLPVGGKRSLREALRRLMPMGGARLVCQHCEYPLTMVDISAERTRAEGMREPVPCGQHDRLCAKCQDDADEAAYERWSTRGADWDSMGAAEEAARRLK